MTDQNVESGEEFLGAEGKLKLAIDADIGATIGELDGAEGRPLTWLSMPAGATFATECRQVAYRIGHALLQKC